MSNTVLALVPATRAMTGMIKSTLGEAVQALDAGQLTVALRDNGPKINGTLILIEGHVGPVGDVFNARKEGGAPYGVHTILGLLNVDQDASGTVSITGSDPTNLIDVTVDTKAPVFQVGAVAAPVVA